MLGHALYMKAIHGGKAKNDKIDAHKIAVLLRGGAFPTAYVCPRGMRATRDLLRRRLLFVRRRSELFTHVRITFHQLNLPAPRSGSAIRAIGSACSRPSPIPSYAPTSRPFSEAAVLFLQKNPRGQRLANRLRSKHGKGKALSILAARLGRAPYYMLRRSTAFDMERFMN